MASTSWPVHSRFAREHFGRGKDEGRAEGLVEGRAKGKADAVLKILATRGIEVPDAARERICSHTDAQLLDVWLERAVSANAVTDLFD
jgi:predicted transposase YdaD